MSSVKNLSRGYVKNIVNMGCNVSISKEKRSLLLIALSHVTITIVSPLFLYVGLFHSPDNYIEGLVKCTVVIVTAFRKSAVLCGSIDDLAPGLVQTDDGGGFCRRMVDNKRRPNRSV